MLQIILKTYSLYSDLPETFLALLITFLELDEAFIPKHRRLLFVGSKPIVSCRALARKKVGFK